MFFGKKLMLFAKTISNNCDMSKEWHCLGYFNKKMEKIKY